MERCGGWCESKCRAEGSCNLSRDEGGVVMWLIRGECGGVGTGRRRGGGERQRGREGGGRREGKKGEVAKPSRNYIVMVTAGGPERIYKLNKYASPVNVVLAVK